MTKRQAKPTNKKKYVSDFPKLVDEWHPIKNGNKRPEDYLYGSNESIWWKCPVADDHEWESMEAAENGYNSPDYQNALKALDNGAKRAFMYLDAD